MTEASQMLRGYFANFLEAAVGFPLLASVISVAAAISAMRLLRLDGDAKRTPADIAILRMSHPAFLPPQPGTNAAGLVPPGRPHSFEQVCSESPDEHAFSRAFARMTC